MIYQKNQQIGNYTVVFPLSHNDYAEEYTVRHADGIFRHLKLFNRNRILESMHDRKGRINEIEVLKNIQHTNICNYVENFRLNNDGTDYDALVTEFVSGETLHQRISRANMLPVYEVTRITKNILEALNYLHTLRNPVIHNSIYTENILVDLSGKETKAVLAGFEGAHYVDQRPVYPSCETDSFLFAPERREGYNTVQTDLYNVGIVMLQMLFGQHPQEWGDFGKMGMEQCLNMLIEKQEGMNDSQLLYNHRNNKSLATIMIKATQRDPAQRFQSAAEMLEALNQSDEKSSVISGTDREAPLPETDSADFKGFAGIAGMEEQKEMLQKKVINILKHAEDAKKYRLSIPNGLLLFGPPGCGKTYFAQKFAEESGYNYKLVKFSDIASTYIHETVMKIRQMFEMARENAPAVLCFDEFDAMVPKRNPSQNQHKSEEVNEFLAQLNNCGRDGIFVIATTNQPQLIDDAILRSGRFDQKIYIPFPDIPSREALFNLHLSKRPQEENINPRILAEKTDGYIASDIERIVNDAAIFAFEKNELISQTILEEVISKTPPSLHISVRKQYEKMRDEFENKVQPQQRIGFQLRQD
ncbi:MAG: AAA family ATPase [Bacteroidales bacterium]|nr:AAA family ATPase [Bacteroidales bacterium]